MPSKVQAADEKSVGVGRGRLAAQVDDLLAAHFGYGERILHVEAGDLDDLDPTLVLMLLALIPMGMVMDGISMLVIAVPLMYPVVANLGFDGIWFGILAVKMVELSLITPPVGVNVYIVAGASDELTVEQAYRGVAPFYLIDSLTIAAMFVFPAIVTFLPSLSRI